MKTRISYNTYKNWYKYLDINKTRTKFQKWLQLGIVEETNLRMSTDQSMKTYLIHTYIRQMDIDFYLEYNGENVGYIEF